MPENRFARLERLRAVEAEHGAMRCAADRLLNAARRDPAILPDKLRFRIVQLASERLEATYLLRLFAEFETTLRTYWQTLRSTKPPAKDLLASLGAMRKIPFNQIGDAQKVREYRNVLIHEECESVEKVPLGKARGDLCHFLAFLPERW
jgi:hypothetical protein